MSLSRSQSTQGQEDCAFLVSSPTRFCLWAGWFMVSVGRHWHRCWRAGSAGELASAGKRRQALAAMAWSWILNQIVVRFQTPKESKMLCLEINYFNWRKYGLNDGPNNIGRFIDFYQAIFSGIGSKLWTLALVSAIGSTCSVIQYVQVVYFLHIGICWCMVIVHDMNSDMYWIQYSAQYGLNT